MPKADFPSETAFVAAAAILECEIAAIKAVSKVECGPEGAFLDSGEPVILFERHKFSRHTGGRFDGARVTGVDAAWGLISYPKWGGYGPMSKQHLRLQAAVALDRDAALKSASWGLFQILGENYAACGYADIQSFVNEMYRHVDAHLLAFTEFIKRDSRLRRAIRQKEWVAFARAYNGPAYKTNHYHTKMAAAYASLA